MNQLQRIVPTLCTLALVACRATDGPGPDGDSGGLGSVEALEAGARVYATESGSQGIVRGRRDGPSHHPFYIDADGGTQWYRPTAEMQIGDCTMDEDTKYQLDFGPIEGATVTVTITSTSDPSDTCTTEAQVYPFVPTEGATEASGSGSQGYVRVRRDGPRMRVWIHTSDTIVVDHVQPESEATLGGCTLQAGEKYRVVLKWIGTWRVSVSIENVNDSSDQCTTEADVVPFSPTGSSPGGLGGRDADWSLVTVARTEATSAFLVNRRSGAMFETDAFLYRGMLGDCELDADADYELAFTWISRSRVRITATRVDDPSVVCSTEVDATPLAQGERGQS